MKKLIEDFSKHLDHALVTGDEKKLNEFKHNLDNVLICGLGGSGICGSVAAQVVAGDAKLPIFINKDYHIPAYVNANTLVIVCSYSGNTEESLEMLEQAEEQGAEISCITSGGKLQEIANSKNYNNIIIPGGHPPRGAFGFAIPALFKMLHHYQVISDFSHEFKNAIQLIENCEAEIREEAQKITKKLYKKIPVIYADANYEGVAIRFRQQINENSKMLCWHHVIPEMNHNELVGWRTNNNDLAVVLFRNEDDYFRTQKRMEVNKTVFEKYTNTILEVYSKGKTRLERSLYLIHLGDWVSYYLSEKNGVDVVEVDVITHLKNELAKL